MTDALLETSRELSWLLVQAAERSRETFCAIAAETGLSVPLARALVLLDEARPMRDLAQALSCDRSWITNVADGLTERGLAERVPGKDRRVKLLQLTDEGRRLRARLSQQLAVQSPVTRNLDRAQQAQLRGLLELLVV